MKLSQLVFALLSLLSSLLASPHAELRKIYHTGSLVEHPFTQAAYMRDVAFSKDGNSIYLTSENFTRYNWRSQKMEKELIRKGKGSGISRSSISPNHRYFARFYGSKIAIHDLATAEELANIEGKYKWSNAHSWSSDSKLFAFGGKGEVLLWDLEKGKVTKTIPHGGDMIEAIAFSPSDDVLVVANKLTNKKGGVRVHCLNDSDDLHRLEGANKFPFRDALLKFSPDGKFVALSSELNETKGSHRPTVKLWDAATGRLLWMKNSDCNVIEFSPDGEEIVVGKLASFEVIDAKSGEMTFEYKGFPRNHHVWDVEYSSDGKYIAIALGNSALVWDREKQTPYHAQRVHTGGIDVVDFSKCGKFVVSGDKSGKVVLWGWSDKKVNWETSELTEGMTKFGRRRSFGVQGLAISDTGDLLCVVNSCSGHSLHTLDMKTGDLVASFGGFNRVTTAPVFSEDGRKVYAGIGRGEILCWDAFTGANLKTYVLSDSSEMMNKIGEVSGLMFDPNDSNLLCWCGRSQTMGQIDLSSGAVTMEATVNATGRGFLLSPHKEWIARGGFFSKLRGKFSVELNYPKQFKRLGELAPSARIASIVDYRSIYLVDMLHYRPFCYVYSANGEFSDCSFSPDGRYLITASRSGLRYVDLYKSTQVDGLAGKSIEQLWNMMGSADSYEAYQATWALSHRSRAVDFLKKNISSHADLSSEELQGFSAPLEEGLQPVAVRAARELIDLGVGLSPERLELLRRPIDEPWCHGLSDDQPVPLGPVPKLLPLSQRLRESRGLIVLELIASEDAKALMKHLATGSKIHPTTREAKYSKLLRK